MTRLPFNPDLAVGGAGPAGPVPAPKTTPRNPLTVSQLTRRIKETLELVFPVTVHVVGQLSNFKRHSSGHLYFTLKDESCELACVMWRSAAEKLKFKPTDGMDLLAAGEITVYERSGRYQFYAKSIEPRGVGALEVAFRQMCAKLQAEGLFDPLKKQKLPAYPRRIGVVTSPTGAAIQDILDTLRRRYPVAEVVLCPVQVQGPAATGEIVRAIRQLNRGAGGPGGVDVLIVGRGGGSTEDLWAFNEEIVARAIFASRIPVISAVGHETDVTVADLVADVRAATPTAAAEMAVPLLSEVLEELTYRESALRRGMQHVLALAGARTQAVGQRRFFGDPAGLVRERGLRLAQKGASLVRCCTERVHRGQRRLGELEVVLQRLHPERFLESQARRMHELAHRLRFALARAAARSERRWHAGNRRLLTMTPRRVLEWEAVRVEALERRLGIGIIYNLRRAGQRVEGGQARLGAMGYRSVLARGFSITRDAGTGRVLRRVEEARPGTLLRTELSDGMITSQVREEQSTADGS